MVKITVIRPDREPETLVFEKPTELTVGRSAGCELCLDFDPMVSRMHAVFLFDPPTVRVKDLNSTNGLMINGVAYGGYEGDAVMKPRELHDGDEVMIGGTTFRIGTDGGTNENAKHPHDIYPKDKSTVIDAKVAQTRSARGSAVPSTIGINETVTGMENLFPEIPGYRIRGHIGDGKTSSVYYGLSQDDGQRVAIKFITADTPFTKKMLDDFLHETQELRLILHPNIVRLIDVGALGPQNLYLVLEYINGEDLESYLRRCPKHRMPLHSAFALMLQLGAAMCYAHTHGLVHRNLKPRNIILFDDNGKVRAKVEDVGLARSMDDSGIVVTEQMDLDTLSIGYTAPEQLADIRDPKPTSDVFSLAAISYEMLTGKIPYDFPGGNIAENMAIVAGGRVVPIEERLPDLPEPLVVVIDRALSAEPEERYQNCCDFLEALENMRM